MPTFKPGGQSIPIPVTFLWVDPFVVPTVWTCFYAIQLRFNQRCYRSKFPQQTRRSGIHVSRDCRRSTYHTQRSALFSDTGRGNLAGGQHGRCVETFRVKHIRNAFE